MARSLSKTEIRQLAGSIGAVLDAVRVGDLDTSVGTANRLEGALVALEAVLGNSTHALERLLDQKGLQEMTD